MVEDRGGGVGGWRDRGWRLQQQACTCVHVPEQADGQEGFSLVEWGHAARLG